MFIKFHNSPNRIITQFTTASFTYVLTFKTRLHHEKVDNEHTF